MYKRKRIRGFITGGEKQKGSGRRFQKIEQVETLDLRKNLLTPNPEVVIGEFKGERCRKCMKLRGRR